MKRDRRKNKSNSKLWILLIIVCLCVMGFSLYQLISTLLEYKAGTDEYDELAEMVIVGEAPEQAESGSHGSETEESTEESTAEGEEGEPEEPQPRRVDFAELKEAYPNVVSWLEIPGTKISYPVMQASDDAYYLNRTFSGKVNSAGSIFMEARNASDYSDSHTLIYGHNMNNGSMFGELDQYKSATFYLSHPSVYIQTDAGLMQYQIFSCHEAMEDDECYMIGFTADAPYAEWLQRQKRRSIYDTGISVSETDKVITLSTCIGRSGSGRRFLVHAKLI